MRRSVAALVAALPTLLLAGCADGGDGFTGSVGPDGVREVHIHIGWAKDHKSQYMRPALITVQQGEKVRFLVTNDDDRGTDYNGAKGGNDNFHDVALLNYDVTGDGRPERLEHETPAGFTARTRVGDKDYFVANTAGTFAIICEVNSEPTHAELGMRATFVVEAA